MNDYEIEDDGLAPRTDEELAVIYEVQQNPAFARQVERIEQPSAFDRDTAILNAYRRKLSNEQDENRRRFMEMNPKIFDQQHKPIFMTPEGWSESLERPFPSRLLRR
jgi:hypothetical protein